VSERNRVSPFGEIVAIDQRGTWMGNRGSLHRGHDIARPWNGRRWITCALAFKGWRAPQWEPGRWTALFFLDEAVALAAGHRPCALCRRAAYERFRDGWVVAFGERVGAEAMDARLHADRVDGRVQRTHVRPWRDLPTGAFVRVGDVAMRVDADDRLTSWTADGWGTAMARPSTGNAVVLTPRASIDVLRAGFVPDR
jgi:hypothetical protein